MPPGAAPPGPPPLRALAELEARGDLRELGAAWFLRGHVQQAAASLERSPPSPERDSDLAAVAYARGRYDEALKLLESALERRPDHPQALWNRGVVLRRMELPLSAAGWFERAAALSEPGWSEDARGQAAALRRESESRRLAWEAARDALQALVGSDQPGRGRGEHRSQPASPLHESDQPGREEHRSQPASPLHGSDQPGREEHRSQPASPLYESDQPGRGERRSQPARPLHGSNPPASIDVEAVARFPGTARELLYHAIRSAPDRQRALALLPLAGALDRASSGTFLRDGVLRAASADFGRRAALARDYGRLVRRELPDPAGLVERLRRSGERDILLGVLLRARAVPRRPAEIEDLARDLDDPWLRIEATMELARLDELAGRGEVGDRRLLDALELCDSARLPYQCLRLHRALSNRLTAANDLSGAEEHGRAFLRRARELGEWGEETASLHTLAQALRFQLRTASARALLEEALARAPGDAQMCSYVHRNLTVLALQDFRVEEARRQLDLALECGVPITLVGAWAISELARLSPAPSDAARLDHALEELSPNVETPGRRVLAQFIRGRFRILSDRAAGQALLREAISAGEPLLEIEANARDAWARSYGELALDAARHGEWSAMLALIAERTRAQAPSRCALGAIASAERTAVVARGPDGREQGFFDGSRRAPPGSSLSGLVPPPLVAVLEGCPRVEVLTAPPLDTRSGLLPPSLAWSYRVGSDQPPPERPPGPPRHLVIANVEAPASLRLAPLAPWNVPGPPSGSTVSLSGAAATPARVLAAMSEASTIDVHTHGVMNPLLSGATAIALAPEPDGRYALTAEAIGRARLRGAPVVSLAACAAAWRPAFLHETFSLPQSFIKAGARAVLAATVDIPDSAGGFFAAVRERIQAGAEPAVALRDERLRWLRADPGARWVEHVLLYE